MNYAAGIVPCVNHNHLLKKFIKMAINIGIINDEERYSYYIRDLIGKLFITATKFEFFKNDLEKHKYKLTEEGLTLLRKAIKNYCKHEYMYYTLFGHGYIIIRFNNNRGYLMEEYKLPYYKYIYEQDNYSY